MWLELRDHQESRKEMKLEETGRGQIRSDL